MSWGQHWSILTFDVTTTKEFYMNEISSMIFRSMARFFIFLVRLYLLPPILIPLSGVGTTWFSSCCDSYLAIIFTTSHLPDVNPAWKKVQSV
jgi:hypothetical protein